MIQQIIIGTLFIGALGYVARLLYISFQAKGSCAAGCGKCATVDFDKIGFDIFYTLEVKAGEEWLVACPAIVSNMLPFSEDCVISPH